MNNGSGSSVHGDESPKPVSGTGTAANAEVLAIHEGTDGWGVVTVRSPGNDYRKEPCVRCPWLIDSPVGAFPPEVFRHSARTAYDLATHKFGCHASPHDAPRTCAGFLLRGAAHNLTVRLYGPGTEDVFSDRPLYANYRAMAIANGVAPDDPALRLCRDNSIEYAEEDHEGSPATSGQSSV